MQKLRRSAFAVFLILTLVGGAWAVYTQHAWEDYYITFRAARNLATGQGLVFTPGERLHTFTSPLGVLVPALSSLLVANRADAAALWVFRFFSIAAFAGGGVLLWRLVRTLFPAALPAALLVALVATDSKLVDFSINGMETGFLLLFLAWTLWALLTRPQREYVHLGLAWAGLMWTRPDSWIYIGALGAGAVLFRPAGAGLAERWGRIRTMLGAGGITTVCYLPWLLWAWWYYGTPIPHTVTAKGLFGTYSVARTLADLAELPTRIATGQTGLAATFLPPYALSTGWPALLGAVSLLLALAAMLLWLLPFVRWEARVASFGALVGQFYLYHIVGFPVPWYIPTVAALSLVALTLVFGQALGLYERLGSGGETAGLRAYRRTLLAGAALWVAGAAGLSAMAAYQLRLQQRFVETGNRRVIGEWLKANAASPRASVFLEPLGYIGHFSGLKMLDYPGLSSPEVVAARRRAKSRSYPDCWPEIIRDLQPDWLVLRPYEADVVKRVDHQLLNGFYELVRRFDVRAQIDAVPFIPGRAYLINDGVFDVYRRNAAFQSPMEHSSPTVIPITLEGLTRKTALVDVSFSDGRFGAHAPSVLEHPVPPDARLIVGRFGIAPGAYAKPEAATDGAGFYIEVVTAEGRRERLLARELTPAIVAADRGVMDFAVSLPAFPVERVEFIITPGQAGGTAFDWTFWSDLRFEIPSPAVGAEPVKH